MKTAALLLLSVISTSAHAASFDGPVRVAKDIETMEAYKPYQRIMYQGIGNHLANTMKGCMDAVENPQTGAFTSVADVMSDGVARSIQTKPETNISRCFAKGLGSASFPQPPAVPGRDGFPIVIDMRIEP
jgi:hypothetical protein